MPPPSQQTKRDIRYAHVKQLAGLDVREPLGAPKGPQSDDSPTPDELLPIILGWINDNPAAIKAAKEAQCTSTSSTTPNWDTVFFTLVESVGMYLRKEEDVAQAILAARAGDYDRAITHLEASEVLIHELAKALDCTFIQLCDFADRGPDGQERSSGAYAGLFTSNNADKPFVGVAFKGSSSERDTWTDLNWKPIVPLRPDVAWGSQMHGGFYFNLFGDFTDAVEGVKIPFEVLLEQLSNAYSIGAKLHITGHSLGGGLCTLAYGEFLRREAEPVFAQFSLGDLYSFAAPRVCYQPFADEINRRTQPASGRYSFRIVNKQDPVTVMPPPAPPLAIVEDYPFIHVGGAWRITGDGPEKMADEPPLVAPPPWDQIIAAAVDHDTRGYYASWQTTPHS
ncbi:hypothetical protein VTO73DRAFT_1395 [Trametes versicolor]